MKPPTSPGPGRFFTGFAVVAWTAITVFFVQSLHDGFRLPKLVLAETLGLLSLLLLATRLRTVERIHWRSLATHPAVMALGPLLLAVTVGALFSDHQPQVRQALVSLWIGVLCAVGWSLGLRQTEKLRALWTLMVPAVFLALVSIGQMSGLLLQMTFTRDFGWVRTKERIGLISFAGSAFELSAFLLLPALLAQWALLKSEKTRDRILWGAVLLVLVGCILGTRTLTTALALVASGLVLWGLSLPRRALFRVTAAGLVVGLVGLAAVEPLRARVSSKFDALSEGRYNALLEGRLDGWRAAWWMFEQQPLVGVGHGAYRAVFGDARLALRSEGIRFYERQNNPYFVNAHSEPLEALAEWGLLGSAALLWALWVTVGCLRRRPRDDVSNLEKAFLWASVCGLAVMSLTNFPLRLGLIGYPYLMLLAWVYHRPATPDSADGNSKTRGNSKKRGAASGPAKRRPFGQGLAAVVMVLLVLAIGWRVRDALNRLSSAAGVVKVERTVEVMRQQGHLTKPMPPAVRQALQGGVDMLEQARAKDPASVRVIHAQAYLYELSGRPDAALRTYRQALDLERHAEIYAAIGGILWHTKKDREAAREAFHKAVNLDHTLRRELNIYFRAPASGPKQ